MARISKRDRQKARKFKEKINSIEWNDPAAVEALMGSNNLNNKKKMQATIEENVTTEAKGLLIYENKERIADYEHGFRAKVELTLNAINQVNNVFPIDSPEEIPADKWLLEKFLERSKEARAMNAVKPLTLGDVLLPEDLQAMRGTFNTWRSVQSKELFRFLKKEKNQFVINEKLVKEEINTFAETQRKYLYDPFEIALVKEVQDYVNFVLKNSAHTERFQFNNPGTLFKTLTRDNNSLYPYVNFEWIRAQARRNQNQN